MSQAGTGVVPAPQTGTGSEAGPQHGTGTNAPLPAGTGTEAARQHETGPNAPLPAGTGTGAALQADTGCNNQWVIDITRQALEENVQHDLKAQFLRAGNMAAATQFFRLLNAEIIKANRQRQVPETQGILPENQYEIFIAELIAGIRDNTDEDHQQVLDGIHQKFAQFNQKHHLPTDWNIGPDTVDHVRQTILAEGNGEQIKSESDVMSFIGEVPQHNNPPPPPADQSIGEVGALYNFDLLEIAARETMFSHSQGQVLYWWKRGTGTQVFVQYGSDDHPIYRIRAGSYEPYDPKNVPRIYSIQRGGARSDLSDDTRFPQAAQPRGHLKMIEEDDDGEFQENWMYTRSNVHAILGVGWKVEDDDEQNEGILDQLWPGKGEGDVFPFTRVLVAWKDRKVTLEDRAFIRRIKRGPTKLGDMVIYHKALSSEILYRQEQGLPCEDLLEDLKALSSRRRPGEEAMPATESEGPTIPVSTQQDAPASSQRQTLASAGGATPSPPSVVPALRVTPAPLPVPAQQGTPIPVGSTPVPTAGTAQNRPRLLASMVRGRGPQGSQEVRTSTPATTSVEDPRDAQIRELQSQLAELRMTMNQQQPQPRYNLRSQAQTPIPSWNQVYRFPSEVSDSPQPPRGRKSRGRKARAQPPPPPSWNYWPGPRDAPSQAYYGYY